MNIRGATYVVGRLDCSYRQGEQTEILGVGMVELRAYVERPCLLVRYADGQEQAVCFEDVSAGVYTLE